MIIDVIIILNIDKGSTLSILPMEEQHLVDGKVASVIIFI